MRWVPDRTGRFAQRPHWTPDELDAQCESTLARFRRSTGRGLTFPLTTDDLTVLLEAEVAELDLYADLSAEGPDVEGVTEFTLGGLPRVRVSAQLSADARRSNRLRTTLTHEFGHVSLHGFLVGLEPTMPMFETRAAPLTACRRGTLVDSPAVDWLEWQAAYASGSLLMPRTAVGQSVSSVLEREGAYGPTPETASLAGKIVDAVVAGFEVSREAATVRLRKLNHLVDGPATGPALFSR
jgi:hypothetical protein